MAINCSEIIERLKSDFSSLWHCQKSGESLEISTPYLLPNDDALSLFVTTRGDRIIVSDGGYLDSFVNEHSELSPDRIEGCRAFFQDHHSVKCHIQSGGRYFFKETEDISFVPSLVFDLGNFVIAMCHSTVSQIVPDEIKEAQRFATQADNFLEAIVPKVEGLKIGKKIPEELPSVRFGSVIRSDTHVWLIGYVTGSTPTHFVRNLSLTYMNFMMVRRNPIVQMATLLALVNNDADGYRSNQVPRLDELQHVTERPPIRWTDRDSLIEAISSYGPKLKQWAPSVAA